MIGLGLAAASSLIGLGMNTVQAIQANKKMKDARAAAGVAANMMKNIKETNQFAQVQVPTLGFDLAQQGIDRSAMAGISATQGAGAEGVIGGAGQIQQAVGASELDLASQANDLKLQRDMAQATSGALIEGRRAEREEGIYKAELTGAQQAAATAEANKNAAIEGAVGSLGSAVTSFGSMDSAYKKGKTNKNLLTTSNDNPLGLPNTAPNQWGW